jgi:hypothetical protein
MSGPLAPGPPATPAHLRAAQERQRLLSSELPRVRAAATAWRNALAGLLTALVGFSLIKGRSDVSELSRPWAMAVGVLLLVALAAGAVGALSLIRAANGQPSVASVRDLLPRGAADHIEALSSAAALRRGIGLTLTCAVMLVAAVGTIWYGPDRDEPGLQVTTSAGTACGSVVRLDRGSLVLKTNAGEVTIDLTQASTMKPIATCATK